MKSVVSELFLYPIKGLHGTSVRKARVLASGALEFDRRWALIDGRGRFVNGKNRVEVHSIRAEYELTRCEVTLNGKTFSLRDGVSLAGWFSERIGESVEWREEAAMGFPDDTDSPGPTLVSAASLARVGEWFGLAVEEVRRRFRTNVVIDGVESFWEDGLYGSRFLMGDVSVDAVNPCQRCVVPSRSALTGVPDAGFQRRFAEMREAQMPASAKTAQFTHYYRFSVNTRIPSSEAGKTIRIGDVVAF